MGLAYWNRFCLISEYTFLYRYVSNIHCVSLGFTFRSALINKQKTTSAEHEMKWCDLDLDGYMWAHGYVGTCGGLRGYKRHGEKSLGVFGDRLMGVA